MNKYVTNQKINKKLFIILLNWHQSHLLSYQFVSFFFGIHKNDCVTNHQKNKKIIYYFVKSASITFIIISLYLYSKFFVLKFVIA